MSRIYRISGAARKAGVCSSTIRNYERRGLIILQRDESGQRIFNDKSIREIKRVFFKLNFERPYYGKGQRSEGLLATPQF